MNRLVGVGETPTPRRETGARQTIFFGESKRKNFALLLQAVLVDNLCVNCPDMGIKLCGSCVVAMNKAEVKLQVG